MDKKDIVTMLTSEDVTHLEEECDIEELILSISGIDKTLEWYKELKKKRIEKIAVEVDKLSKRKERLQEVIKATLNKNNKKSLNFPGVGKVSTRNVKGKWEWEDEDNDTLIAYLQKELEGEELDKIVVTKPTIAKAPLKKVLDLWEKNGSLPSTVTRADEKQSLSVTVDKSFSDTQKMLDALQSVEDINVEDMDDLEI
jgi:hypothetical protein